MARAGHGVMPPVPGQSRLMPYPGSSSSPSSMPTSPYGMSPHRSPMPAMSHPSPPVHPSSSSSGGPPGSLPPGTVVQVGPFTVTVKRYLSQGGFATVYLVNTDRPLPIPMTQGGTRNETTHVLKRIVVPDKEALGEVRREVEVHVSHSFGAAAYDNDVSLTMPSGLLNVSHASRNFFALTPLSYISWRLLLCHCRPRNKGTRYTS